MKKLSGWRRKSEPGFFINGVKTVKTNGLMSPTHDTSISTLDSTESIGEEENGGEEGDVSCSSNIDLCSEEPTERRRESVEEIVGQLVMQNFEFQRLLSKQRLAHLRKALTQHQQKRITRHLTEADESASETETEESVSDPRRHYRRRVTLPNSNLKHHTEIKINGNNNNNCNILRGSQVSSSANGIGSSTSDMNENSTENINVDESNEDELIIASKNVQRTVSDPGNKALLTPRRFINGPLAHYDPISLLWSSFRRTDRMNRNHKVGNNMEYNNSNSKGKTNIRHTHSFSCSHKETNPSVPDAKEPSLPHGDSGVFPNSFTSDSSSSSEANIPTLPAVWLKQQGEHLATPNNKAGSLPRSFQVGQHETLAPPKSTINCGSPSIKSRIRDGKFGDRPFTIVSFK